MTIQNNLNAAIAATRFGLGARAGEIDAARGDPRGFLLAQIRDSGADPTRQTPATSAQRMAAYFAFKAARSTDKQDGPQAKVETKKDRGQLRDDASNDFMDRLQLAISTPDSFRERWALFWLNHFTISSAKANTQGLAGPFENEAIRPRVFGRFEDMLVASSSHPAMLYYLDEARSIGPDSITAQNQMRNGKHPGLNENLAREIMELHTVGLEAGYSQADVTEFARAMTGWGVAGERDPVNLDGKFIFHERSHEPGARTIMGKRYVDEGEAQARSVMRDLAANPHTAHHLAVKIARHFVADEPPPALVDRLKRSYLANDGHLAAVARTLVEAAEAWEPTPRKFKTPYEFLASAYRSAGTSPNDTPSAVATMTTMGQKPLAPPSPKGWPEEAQVWCAPDAIVKRMNWSANFAANIVGDFDPRQVASIALGERLKPSTTTAIARAETRGEGLAIMLMSPEFQRR